MVEPGTVLVRVDHSAISAGTELSGLRASGAPLWQRALRQPAKAAKVIESVASRGVGATRRMVEARLGMPEAIGYSAAGTVLEVGDGILDLQPGDRVACAGAGQAHHAEVIRVARNLVVPIPEALDFAEASTVTLGAIALQGVRRLEPTLGETFVVIGLGILGQLTAQLLRANGCRVIGTDLDPNRVAVAMELGMDLAIASDDADAIAAVGRLTDRAGADGVIITAATSSDEVVSTAFRMCRRKGRVVLVGDVGLDLDRADFYAKELDFRISTSYGPGRYDPAYEEQGLDYPIGYVRWTENRNMSEYLRLLAGGRLNVNALIGGRFVVDDASLAYQALEAGADRPLIVLLQYPSSANAPVKRTFGSLRAEALRTGAIQVAIVGAGSFATSVHIPNLEAMPGDFQVRAVVGRAGHRASAVAAQLGAAYATTDVDAVLGDPDVELVMIATRHDLHARLATDALRRGKHVFVEKPLALTRTELEGITAIYDDPAGTPPTLTTGFNRRFSPHVRRLAELVAERAGPMVLNYRMNAGHIPADSWIQGSEGGGRNLGEACHIYDLFTYLTGSRAAEVQAMPIRPRGGANLPTDNFVATIQFEDGSLATLTYTALGSAAHPKERMEVFVDGRVVILDDYRRLDVIGGGTGMATRTQDKGHRAELEAVASCLRKGGGWPIPLWQQAQATDIALRVEGFLRAEA
jgi:predicted dehydrogenase/threonine dehydrogenase-like Zn-dependent dehydrogenase